ncbi:MAG: trypsin-like serine peptidase [Pseudobdellovibrionaceae bacterium]
MSKKFMTTTVLGFFISVSALAFPLPKAGMTVQKLPANFTADFNFEGIVALSNCSGSLIRLENAKDEDNAMVLTNGHCLETGMPKPGQAVYGIQSTRAFKLFNNQDQVVGRLNATQVMYSTMTKTDMTLYKLKETYKEIKQKYDVNPMTLSSQHPSVSTSIEVISGYWNRGYSCSIEAFISQLKEGGWTQEDSIRYSRPGCLVIGGTSGSPIIQAGTRTVIGINNTGNESGYKCTMNNPCEVDETGNVTAHKDYSYGQQTYLVYDCLNQFNEIDLNLKDCKLIH